MHCIRDLSIMLKMILPVLILALPACTGDVEQEVPRPQTQPVSVAPVQIPETRISASSDVSVPKYSIVKDENLHHFKRSVDVRIPIRYTETQLDILAKHIKNLDKRKYDRTFILYYLPDMEIDAGAWASSHFDPNLKITIHGLSVEKYKELTSLPENLDSSAEMIGRWAYMIALFDIYSKDNNYFMRTTYRDGSSGQQNLQKRTVENETRYYVLDSDFGEYYVVSSRGELKVFDNDGFIESYGMSIK